MTIFVELPQNRKKLGTIWCGELEAPCYGKADQAAATRVGNSQRNQLLRNGDTPTGKYVAEVGKTKIPSRTYGKHPIIRLIPKEGNALLAARNGRAGLLIHGGEPSSSGGLRPTYGCLRVSEETQAALVACLQEHPDEVHIVEVVEVL